MGRRVCTRIATQLMKGAKIERGYIGVSILPVTDEGAAVLGVSDTTGAYVADLTKGGPADRTAIIAAGISQRPLAGKSGRPVWTLAPLPPNKKAPETEALS